MSEINSGTRSRRDFMAKSALAGVALPHVHAAENNTIQVALIGCGGRGTGAAVNALQVKNGPMKVVSMADIVPAKLNDNLALDSGGALVYIAPTRVNLELTKERWPDVEFLATREH